MRKKSYSKQIVEAQVMLDGLNVHKEDLANRGIDDQYIDYFKALIDKCINLKSRQEQAKANTKNLTAEKNANLDQLSSEYQFCKRGVITNIPKSLWNAFGFIYRRRGPKPKPAPGNPTDLSPGKKGDGASGGQSVPGKIWKNGHLLPTFFHFPPENIYLEPGLSLRLRRSPGKNLFLAAKDANRGTVGLSWRERGGPP